jgi:glyoxylase-like metal-dependent hydrolase (beta-lactamase superfamily II)
MAIEILRLTLGPLQTNCYILGDMATQDALVIDPSDNAPLIHRTATSRGWTVRAILATHCHFDHILASAELKALTGAPFSIHALDLPLLRNMPITVRQWFTTEVPPAAQPDSFVEEGQTVTCGGIALDVLFTPGHAPGHVSYVLRSERTVFSGDCLFYGSIGRTDLPGADYETLMRSITTRLLPLGDDFSVAPGHMRNTTIGYERARNPFVMEYLESGAR